MSWITFYAFHNYLHSLKKSTKDLMNRSGENHDFLFF